MKEALRAIKSVFSRDENQEASRNRGILRFQKSRFLQMSMILFLFVAIAGCSDDGGGNSGDDAPVGNAIVVNSLEDSASPSEGVVTLRAAVEKAGPDEKIIFASSLNGGTINLYIIGSQHTILKGETYNPDMTYAGFQERDYGASALYVRKNLTIDASSLSRGITINWAGGEANRARILAVYGDLTMRNVTLTSGFAGSAAIEGSQKYTLARGGAIAVWGTAILEKCILSGNKVSGDISASRDRGAFGGAIYGDRLVLSDCIISGNSATGYGAAGGGVYSVGGAEAPGDSSLTRCAISGNRTTAQHSYGGGVFSEGGGRGSTRNISLVNCTVARNLVMDNPDLAEAPSGYYYRGGGVYMSNGQMTVKGCTIVENAVMGNLAMFKGKPNMGGGGIAATIGDAHVVENMEIGQSIIAGNTVNGNQNDVYSGSLLYFNSLGYNLVGVIDFSQILVPVPTRPWWSLSRKRWPMAGDHDGVNLQDVLSLSSTRYHSSIQSVGKHEGEAAVMWYPPSGEALDRIPKSRYGVSYVRAQYQLVDGADGDFLCGIIEKLKNEYGLGSTFGEKLDCNVGNFVAERATWPGLTENAGWIKFWRDLDTELGNTFGPVKLGDAFWRSFSSGLFGNVIMEISEESYIVISLTSDQRGNKRPIDEGGDIGAIELSVH